MRFQSLYFSAGKPNNAILITVLLITLIASIFLNLVGCSDDTNIISDSTTAKTLASQLSKKIQSLAVGNPDFGDFAPLNSFPDQIPPYGPTGSGWRAIWLPTTPVNHPWVISLYTNARNAGYDPIIANIDRNDILQNNWTEVAAQIAFAKEQGAHWLYVDDALAGDGSPSSRISKAQIDWVANQVHNVGTSKFLATSEWDQSVMQANPTWHENVDIIMPYRYEFNPTQLNSWFSYVAGKGKLTVPILGYHAGHDGGPYYYQTGQLGGGTGPYIETAKNYSSLIIYYMNPDSLSSGGMDAFSVLTNYLQSYYGMGGGS